MKQNIGYTIMFVVVLSVKIKIGGKIKMYIIRAD